MRKIFFFLILHSFSTIYVHSLNEFFNPKSSNYQYNVINALSLFKYNNNNINNEILNYKKIGVKLKPISSDLLKNSLDLLNKKFQFFPNVTEACNSQLMVLIFAFRKRENWAVAGKFKYIIKQI